MGGNASSGGWRSTPPSAGERYLNTLTHHCFTVMPVLLSHSHFPLGIPCFYLSAWFNISVWNNFSILHTNSVFLIFFNKFFLFSTSQTEAEAGRWLKMLPWFHNATQSLKKWYYIFAVSVWPLWLFAVRYFNAVLLKNWIAWGYTLDVEKC